MLILNAETSMAEAIERAHAKLATKFAVQERGKIYVVGAAQLIDAALQSAGDDVEIQIGFLRDLYRDSRPVLSALRHRDLLPRVRSVLGKTGAALPKRPRQPGGTRRYVADPPGIDGQPGEDEMASPSMERFALSFVLLYRCKSGLHSRPGVSGPPTRPCPNGKGWELVNLSQ